VHTYLTGKHGLVVYEKDGFVASALDNAGKPERSVVRGMLVHERKSDPVALRHNVLMPSPVLPENYHDWRRSMLPFGWCCRDRESIHGGFPHGPSRCGSGRAAIRYTRAQSAFPRILTPIALSPRIVALSTCGLSRTCETIG